MKKITRLSALMLGIALSFSLAACGGKSSASSGATTATARSGEPAKKVFKVALILPGSISDASWNAGAYNGLVWLKENRDDIETAYVEEISNEKAEATLTIYAKEGYDIIFAFGSEFTANIIKVAQQYPNTYFANTDQTQGLNLPKNATTFAADERVASFVVGALAGYLSKTDTVGTVEGFESPDLSSNTTQYFAGFKYVKPNGRTLNSYVGSWSDVEKAKQTALAQIEAGVGFIYASGDAIGLGIIEASKEKGIPVVGYGTDLNELAPKNIITSVIWNVGVTYNTIIEDVKNGRFSNSIYLQGLTEGAIVLADYHGTVDSGTAAKIEEIKQKLAKGEIPLN
jgi:basic membrane protein A